MNQELQKFVESKLEEIKNKVKEYLKDLYGDINIEKISVDEDIEKDDSGAVEKRIEITIWTDKGYIHIKS